MLLNVGSGGGAAAAAPSGGGAAPAAGGDAPAEKEEEKKEEGKQYFLDEPDIRERSLILVFTEKEESDEDMGFGLFD